MRTHLPSHDDIAQRAYQLYQQRGCQPGHDLEDWLEAQKQLSARPTSKPSQSIPVGGKKRPTRMSTTLMEEGTNPWEHPLPRRTNAAKSA